MAIEGPRSSLHLETIGGGQVTTDFGSVDTAQDVAVLESGKIVVAGYSPWKPQSLSSASGEALAYSTDPGTKAKLAFTGRNVAWVAPKSRTRGKAEVCLDGRKVATVDLFSATAQVRRVVYAANALNPSVTHTLQIKALGTAGRPRVDVDAFVALR